MFAVDLKMDGCDSLLESYDLGVGRHLHFPFQRYIPPTYARDVHNHQEQLVGRHSNNLIQYTGQSANCGSNYEALTATPIYQILGIIQVPFTHFSVSKQQRKNEKGQKWLFHFKKRIDAILYGSTH